MEFNSDKILQEASINPEHFLIGLLSTFNNRFQAEADKFFNELTWKQFFTIICINLFKENPSITELADVMKSSHQNTKQILLRLMQKGFVVLIEDPEDRRRQRIQVTPKSQAFLEKTEAESNRFIQNLYTGVEKDDLLKTIRTLNQMERNIETI